MSWTALYTSIYWVFLLAAVALCFRLFRDLTDLYQTFFKPNRTKVVNTVKYQHKIALAALGLWLLALLLRAADASAESWGGFVVVSLIGMVLAYIGYVNNRLMFRNRQRTGNYVSIDEARPYVNANESVMVTVVNGEARAHSDRQMLRPHLAGTEPTGGDDVVLTYCGLTHTGIAYTPELNGKKLDLGVVQQLENNLLLVDKNTGQAIQHIRGKCALDNGQGEKMPEWPTFRMPFNKFAAAYPDGKVFINPPVEFFANPPLAIYDWIIDTLFAKGIKEHYDESNNKLIFETITHEDERLPRKTRIFGLNVGNDYVAYTKPFIQERGNLINVKIGGRMLVIAYDPAYDSVGAYWNDSGESIAHIDFFGSSNVGQLKRVETMKSEPFWVVWANYFPSTDVNRVA